MSTTAASAWKDASSVGSPQPAATPTTAADILLVAGMHRSGTSALARVLNLLGAEIPGALVPGFHGNDLGHWEPQEVVDLHEEMLRSARANVNGVFGVAPTWFEGEAAASFAERLQLWLAPRLTPGNLQVIKDPRMALFLPVWRRALAALEARPLVVLPFRDPLEVAASLQRRQLQVYPDAVWPTGRGLLLWLRYVLEAEAASRGIPRTFVGFDALLADWRAQTDRMGAQLGLSWPAADAGAQVEASLRHEARHERRLGSQAEGGGLAEEVLALLGAAVAQPDGGSAGFDAARAALDSACALFQPYVEALELRLGEAPQLRTEYVDFLQRERAPDGADGAAESALLAAAESEGDAARRGALLAEAQIEHAQLATRAAELDALNAALLGAGRRLEQLQAAELQVMRAALQAAEQEAAMRDAAEERAALREDDAQTARAELAGARSQLEEARSRINDARAELALVALRREDVVRELGAVRARADGQDADAAAARLQLAAARDEALRQLGEAQAAQAELRASMSWRLMAPLRLLAARLGRR